MDVNSQTDDISNIDVDGLLAQAEAPGQELPMEAPAPTEMQAPQQSEAQAQAQAAAELAFTRNGQQIKVPMNDPRVTQWLSQGYDYSQNMAKIKQDQQAFEALKPYQEIDKYAKENPEWWAQVTQAYEQRAAQAQKLDPNNPLAQEINTLKQELTDFKNFKNQLLDERTKVQHKQEDEQLDTEIKSMREKFAHLDWNSANEQGYNLERQVIEYANKRGINNFEDAFRAYNFDKIQSLAEERGKEKIAKDIQKKTKLGLLGKTPTPGQVPQRTSLKNVSYEQLMKEGLEEVGRS